jgi:hypothetical protein
MPTEEGFTADSSTNEEQTNAPEVPTPEATAGGEQPSPTAGLQPGRIVYFVMNQPLSAGESYPVRPAIVVRVWDYVTGVSNLQVFIDGANDGRPAGLLWKTSIRYSEGREPDTWHWPPAAP